MYARWPRQTNRDNACRDWVSLVTVENEAKVLACVERYLGSAEVARGVVRNFGSSAAREGWLVECARNNWESNWPPASGNGKQSFMESIESELSEIAANGETFAGVKLT